MTVIDMSAGGALRSSEPPGIERNLHSAGRRDRDPGPPMIEVGASPFGRTWMQFAAIEFLGILRPGDSLLG